MINLEKLVRPGNNFYPSRELLPVRQQQIFDELLKKQKEFASEIYIRRIRERYL